MKKFLVFAMILAVLTITFTSLAGATSLKGISANTTMANYTLGADVKLVVKNDNSYETTSFITPQKLVNSKWVDLDWWTASILKPDKSETLSFQSGAGSDLTAKGTYRFSIETLYGKDLSLGTFNTTTFVLK